MARNLPHTPVPPEGTEVWLSNFHGGYKRRHSRATNEFTRWFNLHSRKWMDHKYAVGVEWYKNHCSQERPLYTQKLQADIPGCKVFPREEIQQFFALPDGRPNRYFTCTVTWLIALAIYEGFERIELWGFALTDTKPGEAHEWERPCFFYWVKQARDRGIEVTYQPEVMKIPFEPGDPTTYTGTLYGYDTKPEEDWDKSTGTWKQPQPSEE